MENFDANTNRTLGEVNAIMEELRATGRDEKINIAELVRDFDGTYYINIIWRGERIEGLPEYVDYRTLQNAVKNAQGGTELPPLKDWIFKRYGRKSYAYLQAMAPAKSCMVEQ